MASTLVNTGGSTRVESLTMRYQRIRDTSTALAEPLVPEDQVVQTIAEVSPTKWHLAHVTWFFERFCLQAYSTDYAPFDEHFHYLFNSYYYTVGEMYQRPCRGLLSRPTVATIHAYREYVDTAMHELIRLREDASEIRFLVELGLNHEQQHQELLLTDIKHVFSSNPLGPAYQPSLPSGTGQASPLQFSAHDGGLFELGAQPDSGFCFDNETPRHQALIRPHALANRLTTNSEYRQFIDAGGYSDPALWLSDGWALLRELNWNRPLYWSEDLTREFTLAGWQPIDPAIPVCHVSYYEADAFARWAGMRLPTEAEWELAATHRPCDGNLLDTGRLHPAASGSDEGSQLYGDVWEWTASPYGPYPGFKALDGSLGEYNGKFMCNQMVVRGGSATTWREHIRASYRSFFYPRDRWQLLGFRLAKDT